MSHPIVFRQRQNTVGTVKLSHPINFSQSIVGMVKQSQAGLGTNPHPPDQGDIQGLKRGVSLKESQIEGRTLNTQGIKGRKGQQLD